MLNGIIESRHYVSQKSGAMEYIESKDYKGIVKELSDLKYALDRTAIVAATDIKGKISSVNDKFCEISGYSREELIGQDHRIINSGTHEKSFFKNLWSTIGAGKIWKGEVCNRRKDGSLYWVYTTIVPFLDDEDKPYQFVAIRQDITELKMLQKTIIDQQTQMISASRLSAIGEMAAAITHEINNPLGVILGRCEMLKKNMLEERLDRDAILKNIEAVEKTGQRIEKIVKSMKLLSYHGESEDFSRVKVNEILSDTLDLCAERFKNNGIQLVVKTADQGLFLHCISYQVVQVLVNLLNNAYDAVEDLKEKWVKIEISNNSNFLEISITDSGSGIPEDIVKNLFQPFFSTKRIRYGTGLGLSVSKSILIKHGGDLILDQSTANTCFKLIFPKK